MNRIMRNSGAALAAIFIAGSLTACGPGSASSSRSDTNPTEVGGADVFLDGQAASPRLLRYCTGLIQSSDFLILVSL